MLAAFGLNQLDRTTFGLFATDAFEKPGGVPNQVPGLHGQSPSGDSPSLDI